eukprot:s1402_g3.t1
MSAILALSRLEFALPDSAHVGKAEFSHEPALRGTRTAALTSEINSIAEVQELRAPGELSERQLEQVRLELAEATADQMEAEAIAAEELRKADRAAERIKQLKALELSDGFQASRASRTKPQPAVLSQSPEAIFFQRNRDLEDAAPEPPKQDSEAPKAEKAAANATNGTRTCDPSIKLSCTAQRGSLGNVFGGSTWHYNSEEEDKSDQARQPSATEANANQIEWQ